MLREEQGRRHALAGCSAKGKKGNKDKGCGDPDQERGESGGKEKGESEAGVHPPRMWGLVLSIVVGAAAVAAPYVMQASPETLTATVTLLATASVLLLSTFVLQSLSKKAPSGSSRSGKGASKTKPLAGQPHSRPRSPPRVPCLDLHPGFLLFPGIPCVERELVLQTS